MTAERKMICTGRAIRPHEQVLEHLQEGWKMDPFFHTSGRPWTVNDGHVWVLVKGSPEEIAELDPFVDLPKPEITEDDRRTIDRFAGIVDVVDLRPDAIEGEGVARLVEKGYEIFNILKGSVILVKRETEEPLIFKVVVNEAVNPGEVLVVCPDFLDDEGQIIAQKVAKIVNVDNNESQEEEVI